MGGVCEKHGPEMSVLVRSEKRVGAHGISSREKLINSNFLIRSGSSALLSDFFACSIALQSEQGCSPLKVRWIASVKALL